MNIEAAELASPPPFLVDAFARACRQLRDAGRAASDYCLLVDAERRCTLCFRSELAARHDASAPKLATALRSMEVNDEEPEELLVLRVHGDGATELFVMTGKRRGPDSIIHIDYVEPPFERSSAEEDEVLLRALRAVAQKARADVRPEEDALYGTTVAIDWDQHQLDLIPRGALKLAFSIEWPEVATFLDEHPRHVVLLHRVGGECVRLSAYDALAMLEETRRLNATIAPASSGSQGSKDLPRRR
jgi:hypothetical protein